MGAYKRIGILGGMSPESTSEFYLELIRLHLEQHNDYSFPEIVVFSVDFAEAIRLQKKGDMVEYAAWLMKGIMSLEKAGSQIISIASNTPHMVFDSLNKTSSAKLMSIVRNTAHHASGRKMKKLLLLGTRFTMQADFYKKDFKEFGIEIHVPEMEEQEKVDSIIYEELVQGIVKKESRDTLLSIIRKNNYDGVILGCTELPMILKEKDCDVPLLDTLRIHARETLREARKD